jgi:hypothetical protein
MNILKEMNSIKEFQVDIMGSKMVIDLDEMMNFIMLDKSKSEIVDDENKSETDPMEYDFAINAAKYEMVKLLIDVLLSTNEEIDEKMGYKSLDNLSFPFKLSFNTLIQYKIIKEVN